MRQYTAFLVAQIYAINTLKNESDCGITKRAAIFADQCGLAHSRWAHSPGEERRMERTKRYSRKFQRLAEIERSLSAKTATKLLQQIVDSFIWLVDGGGFRMAGGTTRACGSDCTRMYRPHRWWALSTCKCVTGAHRVETTV
jgi:hypothetical protein